MLKATGGREVVVVPLKVTKEVVELGDFRPA